MIHSCLGFILWLPSAVNRAVRTPRRLRIRCLRNLRRKFYEFCNASCSSRSSRTISIGIWIMQRQ